MSNRELKSSPNTLALYGRAALPLVPGASRLPFVAGGSGTPRLPDLTLNLRGVTVERDRLDRYAELTGFRPGDALPVTYPFLIGFPLHMALMTDRRFPFAAVGLVHLHNRIVQTRPIGVDEPLDVRVRAEALEPHPKGHVFDLVTEVRVGSELVWTDIATIFRRGKGDAAATAATDPTRVVGRDLPVTVGARWELEGDLGRRYAAVSGDVNPIHLHPLTAKALGFPRAIAHGMWTKARAIAALPVELPDAVTVDVRFQRPVLLPTTVRFGSTLADDDRIAFLLQGDDDGPKGPTPHLRGLIVPRA
ncbi:MAG: MaoC family dehydratase [Solirubrobacteraceae bacterium]|nr:MaoC family dehydratase [Solirubrobacteraceae bacterium]